MLSDAFCERISSDWLWREKDLRSIDATLLGRCREIDIKSAILITYSHWEGHFKFDALELLLFIKEGISKKVFNWTDVRADIRQRLLFCSYRRAGVTNQTHETFISHLNGLHDARFVAALDAKAEIVMIDDNWTPPRTVVLRGIARAEDWVSGPARRMETLRRAAPWFSGRFRPRLDASS